MSERAQLCKDVIDRMIAALRTGGDVPATDRRHLATCPDCGRVLKAAGQLEDALEVEMPAGGIEAPVSRVTKEAQAALTREQWRRAAVLILGAVAALIPWLMEPRLKLPPDVARVYGMLRICGAVVGLGAVGTLLLQRLNSGTDGVKLYKRLKGQWFFGVCRGLAEAAGVPVGLIRAGVVALMLAGKNGWMVALAVYFLLDMSLEVHPEDRGLLLRFRFRRWLDKWRASPGRGAAGGEAPAS